MTDSKHRVPAFQINVGIENSDIVARLQPPTGKPSDGPEGILVASVNAKLYENKNVATAFEYFLKVASMAMVADVMGERGAATAQFERRDFAA